MPSFDAVCSADMAEVRQAVINTRRNFGLRLDCKDTSAAVSIEGNVITLTGDSEAQLADLEDVLLHKLMKRRVDARFVTKGPIAPVAGGALQQRFTVRSELAAADAERMRAVLQAADDALAVTPERGWVHVQAVDKEALRAAMHVLREQLSDLPIGFANLRV